MLSNQDNTQMPGAMPGSMPGSMPENNNTTHNALNQDAKPSIGGPSKIQSGVPHHELPVNNTDNVHNNTHGEHNFSKNKTLVNNAASGMTGHQNDVNPLHSNHGENSIVNNNDHHYKRDAAAAGAAGLAGHESKDHQNQQFGFANHRAGSNPIQSGLGHNNSEGTNSNPFHSGNDKLHQSSSNDDHHYKRDAALGAGAAGLAGHELKNHHDQSSHLNSHSTTGNPLQSGLGHNNHEGVSNNPLHSEAGLGNNHTSGGNPLHYGSSNLSNDNDHHYKRDAALGAGAAGLAGHELKDHHGNANPLQPGVGHKNHESINQSNPLHSEAGLGHTSAGNPLHPGSNNLSSDNDHHYKRDAALGAGAAGLAGHELKNHQNQQFGFANHRAGSNPIQSDLGHNNSEGTNSNPLHSGNDKLHQSSGNDDHHYKRDAALGAGAAGLAGHELKDRHGDANPLQSGVGHNNHNGNLLHSEAGLYNPIHPASNTTSRSLNDNNDHHYKRDAALGAGAAGLAGHELKNHHDKQSGLDGTSPLHSGSGLDNHHSATGNPLHSGSEHLQHPSNDNDHHYKRDAALGAGAAGLTGHELKNHHDNQVGIDNHHNGSNPLHSGSGPEGTHHATGNPLHPGTENVNHSINDNNDHHYKRDAALGTGAAGLAGHELKNHHDKESGLEGAHRTSGNPLHSGSDNVSRSVNDNNDHHYKRDAALGAGAAGLAGHELKNHHDKESGLEGAHRTSGNPLHSGSDDVSRSVNDNNDHHYKRDAALGTGAAGLAGHELKNHHDKESGLEGAHCTPGNPLHSGSDNVSRSVNDNNDHHYKRDAALGAGAAGAAGHEMKEHHDKKEAASGRTSVSSASSGEKKGAAVHDKPLNTGGDAHHVAEQPPMGLGGLTGKQPVGEINFHKLS